MAWLHLSVVETVTDNQAKPFRVTMAVTAADGVTEDIFVMEIRDDADSDRYAYTATPSDVTAYPAGRGPAKALENDIFFYRTNRVTLDFTTQKQAVDTVTQARSRIARLVKDAGDRSSTTFGGAELYTFDSEDA